MEHFYESLLIDSIDDIQCKVYANSHPPGLIIVKPKYIPVEKLNLVGLKKRFLFSKAMYRFNLFNDKEIVEKNLKEFEKKLPYYVYYSQSHKNWFFVVPRDKIKKIHDPKEGLKELMKVPESDLDNYLKSVVGLIKLILESGVSIDNLGINHSTLMGNYTPGKSDIDLVVYGVNNGWRVINFLEKARHPLLKWKTEEEWRRYYKDRIVSKDFSEDEYVANMIQKKDDGFYDGNVFSVFCVEEKNELWYDWEDEHNPLGVVKIQGVVSEAHKSIVRPGYYELEKAEVIEGYKKIQIKRIVNWSRPFSLQAKKGDRIECVGLLEEVKLKNGESFFQIVLGYLDAYTNERGEKEYLKKLI